MPRRKIYHSPDNHNQTTLLDFLSSSPASSPIKKTTPPRSKRPLKRKRGPPPSRPSPSPPVAPLSDRSAEDPGSDVGAIQFEPEVVDISDGDDSPRRPNRRKNLVVSNADPHTISDDSVEEIELPRHRKGKSRVIYDSEDDTRPRRRKLIKGVRPPTPEEDDILTEGNPLLESRLRLRGKMTAFQKNLEKLRNLKGKKRADIVLDSSSENELSEDSMVGPIKGARPHRDGESDASSNDSNGSEEDVDDFIVEDDAHGAPATELPIAFSLSTHQDLAHQFKIVCQLFVHLAVRPLTDRRPFLEYVLKKEQYFSVPLQVMRRKLSGLRDSLVASSVWRPNFKKYLERYPTFTLARLNFSVPQCDACHLGGRVSTLQGQISGKPYDGYDYEDVSDDESDEGSHKDEGDEDEDEEHAEDEEKEIVKKLFHLGRFCATRTQVYHQFSHWEHSLYKSLQREITEAHDKRSGFVKVAYYGGLEPPRDLHNGDKVMDWLDQRGIIEIEWKKVRDMMDSARNLEISWKRGDMDAMDMA